MKAWAKINLGLDILGTRPDGYHEMRMVMQSISLCDEVSVEKSGTGFTLRMNGLPFVPRGGRSMEEETVHTFFHAIKKPIPPLSVALEKQIPAYAGLGGGSADAAALLRALRETYAPDLTEAELERIGLTVGSDVPFCLRCGTALAEGRGERLTDLPPLPDCWLVICKPPFNLPTPEMFARIDRVPRTRHPDLDGMLTALEAHDLEGVAVRMENVFEDALPREFQGEISAIKSQLLSLGALGAAMSGSGPTVFGVFRQASDAGGALSALKALYEQTFLARPHQGLCPRTPQFLFS